MAKVSVCIPTYNNPECVRRLLDSLQVQTFQDFEILLSDDSTDDRIAELVKAYPGLPIQYRHNAKPLGHIFNWNAVLDMAGGQYIKIMFSDDWFTDSDGLEKFVALLEENPQASLAFSGSLQVSEKSSCRRCASDRFFKEMEENWHWLFGQNEFGAPSAVMVRNCGARFDEKSNWASDLFFYFEVLSKGGCAVGTKEPLVSIGVHEEQYTQTFSDRDMRKYEDFLWMYEKYGLAEDPLCRKLFLDRYLMWYQRSWKAAKGLGFSRGEYLGSLLPFLWKQDVCCFVKNKCRQLRAVWKRKERGGRPSPGNGD